MATLTTIADYITCSSSDKERLERMAEVITLLETKAIQAVENADVQEYEMNDGQVKIKTSYNTLEQIARDINAFQSIYDRLFNRCFGTRIVSLRDAKSFNLRSNGY